MTGTANASTPADVVHDRDGHDQAEQESVDSVDEGGPRLATAPSAQRRLAEEVDRQLAGLRDAPLAEHPRVYETLEGVIRQHLQAEQEPDPARGEEPAS
jgi:hypothetical protein